MYNFSTDKTINKLHFVSLRLSRFDKYWGITLNRGIIHIGLGNRQISIWRE